MKYILNKDQVVELNEAAVAWEKSALGILTGTLLRPISWLRGSIKKGLKKQQINNQVKFWQVEYAKALKAVDTGESETPTTTSTSTEPNNSTEIPVLTTDLKNEILTGLKTESAKFKHVVGSLSDILKWDPLKIDLYKNEYVGIRNKFTKEKINVTFLYKALEYLPEIKKNFEKDEFVSNLEKINKLISAVESSNTVQEFIVIIKNNGAAFIKPLQIINNGLEAIVEDYNLIIEDFTDLQVNDTSEPQNATQEAPTTESMINEAVEGYKLPDSLQELISPEQLEALSKIKDIKELSFKQLNLERLNTIMYEAKFIINKAKNSKNKDRDDNSAELQKIWDVGVQNTNDYFQKVIDTEKVIKLVVGNADSNTKLTIQKEQETLNELQTLGADEVLEVGKSFNENKLYAFTTTISRQGSGTEKHILFMSPCKEFNEEINKDKYFFFRLFGGFKVDKKTNAITRVNIFTTLSNNTKMKTEFNDEQNSYYVCFTNLRPNKTFSNMFVYSNKGGIFFNNIIEKDVNNIRTKVVKGKDINKSLESILKISNVFKYNIDQRFIIDDQNVIDKKYTGIEMGDLKADQFINQAKKNHEDFLKLL